MRVAKIVVVAAVVGLSISAGAAIAAPFQISDYVAGEGAGVQDLTAQDVVNFTDSGVTVSLLTEAIADSGSCPADGGCSVEFRFDGGVVNQSGVDLVLAGVGIPRLPNGLYAENFNLEINGVLQTDFSFFDLSLTFHNANLQAIAIDLSDFGVALGEAISSVALIVDAGGDPIDRASAGALEDDVITNPIPAAAWLFGTAALGGGCLGRKKRRVA